MTTSSNDRRRGSQPVEINTSEVPVLRETFTMEGATERWAHPCPDWRLGQDYDGHDAHRIASGRTRQHGGAALEVRTDGSWGYYDEIDAGHGNVVEGVRSSHLSLRLVSGSREISPRVAITTYSGTTDGDRQGYKIVPLFMDEVDELIAVLQYLRSTAGAK